VPDPQQVSPTLQQRSSSRVAPGQKVSTEQQKSLPEAPPVQVVVQHPSTRQQSSRVEQHAVPLLISQIWWLDGSGF
jgi:hypothetical protein